MATAAASKPCQRRRAVAPAAYGNIIGRSARWQVEADKHYTNLFTVIVGRTAKARRGTSLGYVKTLPQSVEGDWTGNRIMSGLAIGEGLSGRCEIRSSSTKKQTARSTGAHIGILAHVTADELLRLLSDTAAANGYANRFLYCCSKRSKLLPVGGNIGGIDWMPMITELGGAVNFGRTAGVVRLDAILYRTQGPCLRSHGAHKPAPTEP